jgi:hypothetical protein
MRRKKNVRLQRVYGNDRIREFKEIVLYSALGLGTATGLVLVARHFWNKAFQGMAQKTNLTEGDASTFATKLYMAMGNEHWYASPDKAEIFSLLRQIPSTVFFNSVQAKYKDNYKSSLTADLEKTLTPSEYNLAVLIKSGEPNRA